MTAFARRRLGITAGERLLEPLVSGLYAGDPDQVSLPAAFPMLAAKERDHRSFLLAMRRELAPARNGAGPRLASFQDGLAELTSALALALGPDLHLQTRIVRVDRQPQGFRVTVEDHGMVHTLAADAVALAMPAYAAGAIVAALDVAAADALALTPYVPVALVHLGYAAAAIARPLAAYGFFVPPSEPLARARRNLPLPALCRARSAGPPPPLGAHRRRSPSRSASHVRPGAAGAGP